MDKIRIIFPVFSIDKQFYLKENLGGLEFLDRLGKTFSQYGFEDLDLVTIDGGYVEKSFQFYKIHIKKFKIESHYQYLVWNPFIYPDEKLLQTLKNNLQDLENDKVYIHDAFVFIKSDNDLFQKNFKEMFWQWKWSDLVHYLNQNYQTQSLKYHYVVHELHTMKDFKTLEKSLYQSLIKNDEGFMSKHFERKLSLLITYCLINTSISPNMITLISTLCGIWAGILMGYDLTKYGFSASLLFWFHSILDGCDGEIARLKYLSSKRGGIFDFWSDNVVHIFIFGGIAWGYYQLSHQLSYLGLGFLAIMGTLLSATFVFKHTMVDHTSEGPLFRSVSKSPQKTKLNQWVDYLSRRDFIYLVIILSFFGRLNWFLTLAAIGSNIFALIIWKIQKKED